MKRFLSIIIAVLIMIPVMPVSTSSAAALRAGDDCIELIKRCEGFSRYKYWDYSQWTIGYGTYCKEDEYPDGITEAEADALLRKVLVDYESILQSFINKNNITLSQCQYDALVCYTYALGSVWTKYDEFDLKTILINGSDNYSFLEIAQAFGEWRCAGGKVLGGLVKRRHEETALFLSDRTESSSEVWRVTAEDGLNIRLTPSESGTVTGKMPLYTIFGVTEKRVSESGVWGRVSCNGVTGWCSLGYAKYMVGGPLEVKYDIPVSPVDNEIWKVTASGGLKLRSGPGLSYSQLGIISNGKTFTVTASANADGYTWGKTVFNGQSGWCALNFAELQSGTEPQTPVLKSIYISSQPNKKIYLEGEAPDMTGLEVRGRYSDGSEQIVTDYEISALDTSPGTHSIKVTFQGMSAQFNVTIKPKSLAGIEIASMPDKTDYKTGELLELTGLKVNAVYDNGAREEITAYTYNIDSPVSGMKTVTVSYNGFEASFKIRVAPKTLCGIKVTAYPDKTSYALGDDFDPKGMTVYAYYDNNSKLKIEDYTIEGYNPNKIGIQNITIRYSGYTDSFDVSVTDGTPVYARGDVDGNGTVDIIDLISLKQYLDNELKLDTSAVRAADADGNGTVNQHDADIIAELIVEK